MQHRSLHMIRAIMLLGAVLAGTHAYPEEKANPVERVVTFTDRTLYIAGEQICFSLRVYSPGQPDLPVRSRIIYVELVTPDGFRVNSGKFIMDESFANGRLVIPKETLTGYYYLKAYTRVMRNEGPLIYHYSPLKIVNSQSPEVARGKASGDTLSGWLTARGFTQSDAGITLDMNGTVYSSRETVTLSIATALAGPWRPEKWCLTVVPEAAIRLFSTPQVNAGSRPVNERSFLVETRGLSLSGWLKDTVSGEPVADARINLTVIGDKDFMASMTDPAGNFYFSIPAIYGRQEVFLSPPQGTPASHYLEVDQDFCTLPVSLPGPGFELSKAEGETALSLASNVIITDHFHLPDSSINQVNTIEDLPFYGKPTDVIRMDQFIPLPELEDYFIELPFPLKVRKSEGRKYFRFFSFQAEMNIYDPLLLIDGVAINAVESVLAMSPQAVERIEMVNAPYVKGGFIYGGIINFISKKRDYGNIDLPSTGIFIGYDMLEIPDREIIRTNGSPHLPDSRNTLTWIPGLILEKETMTQIAVTTPDTPGKYVALIRGVDRFGEVHAKSVTFEVR